MFHSTDRCSVERLAEWEAVSIFQSLCHSERQCSRTS
jgi:hypothetical protein